MHAREYTCRLLEVLWLTPTVMRIRFEPLTKFDYAPGQFVSLLIPPQGRFGKALKRCYSFSSSPDETSKKGYYELCVKYVEGGRGSQFLASLTKGDLFRVYAPYGHFTYKAPTNGARNTCFIATGTGIAPFRSIVMSEKFQKNNAGSFCLFGARTADEIIYKEDFEKANVKMVCAVSRGNAEGNYQGRVTDYLRDLPKTFPWHQTDFYICGNGMMVAEVDQILRGAFGVQKSAIFKEAFSVVTPKPRVVEQAEGQAQVEPTMADESFGIPIGALKEVG